MNCIFKKTMSLVLMIVMLFSVAATPAHAGWMSELVHDQQDFDEGYTPTTTQQFITLCDDLNDAIESMLGVRLIPEEKIQVTVDGFLADVFADIKEDSGGVLDCALIAQNFPSMTDSANKVKTILQLDMAVVSPALAEMSGEFASNGNMLAAFAVGFLNAYLKTIDNIELYSKPYEGHEGSFVLFMKVNYADGSNDDFDTGLVYDSINGTLNSKEGNGMFALGFVLDTNNSTLYTAVNSWQRNFGFTVLYDVFVYMTDFFDYVTVRVHFTYDNREWMVQLWKGKYFIAPGSEIGIYTRDIGSIGTFYNCASDEDMMNMSMKLYHKDNLILELGPKRHWWLTGFQLAPKAYVPASLTLHGTIEFPTEEMAKLFVENANATGEIKATNNGALASFVW